MFEESLRGRNDSCVAQVAISGNKLAEMKRIVTLLQLNCESVDGENVAVIVEFDKEGLVDLIRRCKAVDHQGAHDKKP